MGLTDYYDRYKVRIRRQSSADTKFTYVFRIEGVSDVGTFYPGIFYIKPDRNMKLGTRSSRPFKSVANVQEITIIVLTLGIVFFVLYAVYKNVAKLGNIRSIGSIPPHSYRLYNEGFSNGTRPSLDYSSYPNNEAIDSKKALLIQPSETAVHNKESQDTTTPTLGKIWGFNGLYGGVGASDKLVDVFYSATSDNSCPGSGYTKGTGNLCLDKTQTHLLTSRGGNASTYDHFKS